VKIEPLLIPGVAILRSIVHRDERGLFYEAWREQQMSEAGLPTRFVQDNISVSGHGVVRGLHLQHPKGQGKLVRAVAGRILDVCVDVRVGSPAYGAWLGIELGEDDGTQVYLPPGIAHGFAVLSDVAAVCYKCTTYYEPSLELTILFRLDSSE
jgi:dTDP-4-dehydrorhamnose 3,5-epimerase